MSSPVGSSVMRKESFLKVTGMAKYTNDLYRNGDLTARLLLSPHAHARLICVNTRPALEVKGVKAVITGEDSCALCGVLIQDRPPIAKGVVRYAGEPVAMAVAIDEATALRALSLIEVEYEPLPHVLTPIEALEGSAPILHSGLEGYRRLVADVRPVPGTNIASQYHIRKGDMAAGWSLCDEIITRRFSLPPTNHQAMEVRTARAEISADGMVNITTASQSPYAVIQQLSQSFCIQSGSIQVHVPFVGGGFGGKAPVILEHLAYIASLAAGGRPVRLIITREQDMAFTPCRLGLEAEIKLGADSSGRLKAAELRFWVDCGAYADIAPNMAKSLASDCTGPYRVDNLFCDSLCVYTNHTFATSYRGFSHAEYTFCIERAMDELAKRLNMDALELRIKNAIRPGDLTPTQVCVTPGNTGDMPACIEKLKSLSNWTGDLERIDESTVRAKGLACVWKASALPTNSISGAMVTFNSDGSLNLNTGVVEMGSGGQTQLAQILADKLNMDVGQIHVQMGVDTRVSPEHHKTVASMTGYMAGNAVLRAAEDILGQLGMNGALALGCKPSDIVFENGAVYEWSHPEKRILITDLAAGYKAPDGSSIGEPVLGRGGFMLKGLTELDPVTGKGQAGPAWTVGAQAVEIEYDTLEHTYRILNAYTVMDVGMAINPDAMCEIIRGGMCMGLSMASRERCTFDSKGRPSSPTLRTYKLMHIGQEPRYYVELMQTPQEGSPYGTRSISEHGILGMPAALANALARASGIDVSSLPILPQALWSKAGGDKA